jgi:hypothetical protein
MSANKLTDTQLVLLSAAAQHPEGAIELASNLKGAAAKKAVGKLLHDGLIEEVPAGNALPVWRRPDDAGPLGLRITPHGLAAALRRTSPSRTNQGWSEPRTQTAFGAGGSCPSQENQR